MQESTERNAKQSPGPPMTLGNMRELGVYRLVVHCNNDECRHTTLIDVFNYSDGVEVSSFQRRTKCGKCGGKRVDVRPNWRDAPTRDTV
jgi:hypothetical protein